MRHDPLPTAPARVWLLAALGLATACGSLQPYTRADDPALSDLDDGLADDEEAPGTDTGGDTDAAPGDTGTPGTDGSGDTDGGMTSDTDPLVDTDAAGPGDTDAGDTDTDAPGDTDAGAGPGPGGLTGPATAMIVEVLDGDSSPAVKFVELYNPGADTLSLDGWSLQKFSNGAGSPTTTEELDGLSLPSGETLVIAYASTESTFISTYGQAADVFTYVVDGNGNDVYAVHDGTGVVDVYGVIGVDGTGEDWEYSDADAKRLPGVTAPSATWDADEWVIHEGEALAAPFSRD